MKKICEIYDISKEYKMADNSILIFVSNIEKNKLFSILPELKTNFNKVFNTDEVEIRILNGDGGGWIKGGLIDETVHFQLDPFHLNRDIVKKVRDKTQKNNIMLQELIV